MATTTTNIQVVHTGTLNNKSYEYNQTYPIANIEELRDDNMRIPAAAARTVYTFGVAVTDDFADYEYVIFENTDTTNFVTLGFLSGSEESYVKLPPNGFYVMTSDEINANSAGGGFGAFVAVDTITALADTGDVFVNITLGVKQ